MTDTLSALYSSSVIFVDVCNLDSLEYYRRTKIFQVSNFPLIFPDINGAYTIMESRSGFSLVKQGPPNVFLLEFGNGCHFCTSQQIDSSTITFGSTHYTLSAKQMGQLFHGRGRPEWWINVTAHQEDKYYFGLFQIHECMYVLTL